MTRSKHSTIVFLFLWPLILSEGDITLVSHDKGKFGRILGELFVKHEANLRDGHVEGKININQQMIADHHAVEYTGENKDTTTERHMEHRKLLIENGTVTQEAIDEVS